MPSLVTGIIGGIQGASAAHNAANAQTAGYGNAAQTVKGAVADANPILGAAATTAGTGVTDAATAAGQGVTAAAGQAGTGATTAADAAASGVTGAAGNANALLDPYISSGSTAQQNLSNLHGVGEFSFNPSDLQNTPGYQFQMAQGLRGVNSANSAGGMRTSGGALKAASMFASGLADSTYNTRYNQALQGYGANLQGYQSLLNTYLPQAQMGMAASGQAGSNLMNASQYAGNAGINAAQYAGNTGMAGAEFAGNAGINAAQYAGNAGMWAGGTQASNLVNAGVYQGNTQIGAGNAQAQGDIGAANQWNGMLGAVGQAGNAALGLGFAPGGGGWSPTNIATNMGNLWGAGNYGQPAQQPRNTPGHIGAM